MKPTPCGHLRELEELINDALPPDHAARLVAHVETCEPCQRQLERLVTRPLGTPFATSPPGGNETADLSCPAAATEPVRREAVRESTATSRTDGTMTGCHSAGETTDDSPAGASSLGMELVSTKPEVQDPDRTMSRSGLDNPPTSHRGETPRASHTPRIPGYELLEKLGEGGMGVVYKARQRGLNRLVALKMIRGGSQARPDHFARFRVEAEAVARLRHPNILQIYDIGEVDGLPFVSLELLEGGSLADRLDGTPQPGRQAAELLITLAAGRPGRPRGRDRPPRPQAVQRPLHRGRRPQDHRLRPGQAAGVGQPTRPRPAQIMGSPSYMAPEQARGPHQGRRPGRRRLRPGGDPLRDAHRPAPVQGRDADRDGPPGDRRRGRAPLAARPQGRPRPGDDLPEVPEQGAVQALRLGRWPWPTTSSATATASRSTPAARPLLERGIKWARRRPAAAALLGLGIVVVPRPDPRRGWSDAEPQSRRRWSRLVTCSSSRTELIDRGQRSDGPGRDLAQRPARPLEVPRRAQEDETEPRLEDLPALVKDALDQVRRRQAQLELEQRARGSAEAATSPSGSGSRTFVGLRTQAQLHAAEFELDPAIARDGSATRSARPGGLRPGSRRRPRTAGTIAEPLPAVPRPTPRRRRVADGCYDLLLFLSQARRAGHGPEDPRSGGEAASRSRPRRTTSAAPIAWPGPATSPAEHREEELADQVAAGHRARPLPDRPRAARRTANWSEAIAALETAVRLDPDQTAAQPPAGHLPTTTSSPKRLGEALEQPRRLHRAAIPTWSGSTSCGPWSTARKGNQALVRIDPASAARATGAPGSRPRRPSRRPRPTTDRARSQPERRLPLRAPGQPGGHVPPGRPARGLARRPRSGDPAQAGAYQAYATLGQLHQRQGGSTRRPQAFGRAIERAPDPATRVALHRSRALLYANRRDLPPDQRAAAIADLDEAIRLEPENDAAKAERPRRAGPAALRRRPV